MINITKNAALQYHAEGKPGKIEVIPTKPYSSQRDLALAYSPGVAEPCLEIEKDSNAAYKYTAKGNLVAVISNGTAVLGLGDIGAIAGKPVMEGKGLLFKIFAGIDVFDIEINEKDPKKFIDVVKAISPTFGGINLEDIKAPECFEIEDTLKKELDIPIMHDDQHGTAIISSAGLINALEIVNKKIEEVKIVVNGAGAAANSCAHLYLLLGVKKENIVMVDSRGVINKKRQDLNERKRFFVTDRDISTLEEALVGADMFLGLSVAGVLTKKMIQSMNYDPIVFALANPNPEITYEDAMESRKDMIFATGRSDYPNQINNVLGFPYIFRGALDVSATCINEEMKLAAAKALAELTKKPVPDIVNSTYDMEKLSFGRNYIIPKPMDPRLLTTVSPAVAKAAMESGVARKEIVDWDGYNEQLLSIMGSSNKLLRRIYDIAKKNPKRVVFSDSNHINILKAAEMAYVEGICFPILLGNIDTISAIAKENEIDLSGIEIISMRQLHEEERRTKYATLLWNKMKRKGMTYEEAYEKMWERNYFAMMMLENGDADAVISGVYSNYKHTAQIAIDVIGIRENAKCHAAMHIINTKKGMFFLADTMFNEIPSAQKLADIAKLTHDAITYFSHDPVIALLSYSNFGSEKQGSPEKVREAVSILHKTYPDMNVDGEMQVTFALNNDLRDKKFNFTKLYDKKVNTLIFPNLSSANVAYRMLIEMGVVSQIGPIQMGLNKPVHILELESTVRDIVNMTAVAVVDAVISSASAKKDL